MCSALWLIPFPSREHVKLPNYHYIIMLSSRSQRCRYDLDHLTPAHIIGNISKDYPLGFVYVKGQYLPIFEFVGRHSTPRMTRWAHQIGPIYSIELAQLALRNAWQCR